MDFYKEWLGIPEGVRPPDHYELLRCKKFEDDLDKIRGHYKKLNGHVRKYATGQYSIQSQDMLNELAKAMLCLTDIERKRDYDETLGREFPPEKDIFGRQPMLDVLIRQGKLERVQKAEVEEFADKRGLSHRDAVVQMKLVEPADAAQALAISLGYSYVDLEDMTPEDSVLDMVPRNLVKKYSIIPLFIDDDRLLVACIDELDHEVEEELRLRYGVPVRPVIAVPRAINQAIAKYYAPGMRDEAVAPPAAAAPAGKAAKPAKTAKPSEKAARPAAKPAAGGRVPFSALPPEEQQRRKQIGYLLLCWSVIVPMLPLILSNVFPMQMMALRSLWMAIVITLPATAAYVFLSYWK
ncbi:MAG: general secretion pathway protein GspE [Planctomyces sp.]|nr:general secretion pathway protein GspE [Planctomyces sp.]